jgi:uncharacterized protein YgiM (DUF1202 family)
MCLKSCGWIVIAALSILALTKTSLPAQESQPFQAEVISDNINIRANSTVNSEVICAVNKGAQLEVVSELYDWYKIRLPKKAPAYIKKSLLECINYQVNNPPTNITPSEPSKQCLNAKVIKENVNIRLKPTESSAILGQADKNEVVTVLEDKGEWFRIEPTNSSFGWIHKKFINALGVPKTEEKE